MRVRLAAALLSKPDILLLDEPTNHLDLESITAFNNSLKDWKHVLLLATHDHEFAQTVGNRVIEIGPTGVVDKLMSFDEYISSAEIKAQREAIY